MVMPLLSEADPRVSAEGSIDPLGTYAIADAMAVRMIPGVRERQQHPRFLTSIAVSLSLCSEFDDELVAFDDISEPWQVFEWHFVEGMVLTTKDRKLLSGLPGQDKASSAIKDGVPLSAKRYLKTPTAFGFHGVYRALARDLEVEHVDRLGETGHALLTAWEKDQVRRVSCCSLCGVGESRQTTCRRDGTVLIEGEVAFRFCSVQREVSARPSGQAGSRWPGGAGACDAQASTLVSEFPDLLSHHDDLLDIVRRNIRTPSFLVRFFPLDREKLDADAMQEALDSEDLSGLTLRQLLRQFFTFLVERCGEDHRKRYIQAVKRIQTGSHFGVDVASEYDDDELQGSRPEYLLPNVRLVNGKTRSETRQRLMLTYNTPFYPEILVASSVMAEGVDLHLNCRYMIHHDLCWNPSTLEQRSGRVDRIGAKAETAGRSIHIYIPFIAETQDEKMYRVVMDRERWFNVVMGEDYKVDARTTEKLANRIPFPPTAANELAFHLGVVYDQ